MVYSATGVLMPYSQPTQPLRRSLATRVVVITVLCALLLSVLLTALLSYASYRYELIAAHRQFSNIEKSYLPSLAAGLWEVDTYRINTLLDGIAQLEDVGNIRLSDELEQQFSRTHPDFSKPLATKDYPVLYQVDGEQFPVGQLHIQLMSDHIEQRLWRLSLAIALVTVCALLLSAMLMLAIFRFAVSKHLHAMARFASQLDLNKLEQALYLDRRPRQDELDQVVDAMNRLRRRIMHELARRSEIENQLNQQAAILEQQGIINYLVEIGGEMRLRGTKPDNKPWKIAIEKPVTTERAVQRILAPGDMGVATSGDYRNYFEEDGVRYSHLLDPRTGKPITNRTVSVTVLHPSCMTADGYATALNVMDAEAAMQFAEQHQLAVLLVLKTDEGFIELTSSAFKPYLTE